MRSTGYTLNCGRQAEKGVSKKQRILSHEHIESVGLAVSRLISRKLPNGNTFRQICYGQAKFRSNRLVTFLVTSTSRIIAKKPRSLG